MLFVDGANDAVSIGVSTDAPAAVLEVVGDGAAGKPTLSVTHAENTSNAVNITADSITTAKALRISADALTTGNALYIDDNSSSTGTRQTAIVIQNNAAAINATALHVQSDGGITGVELDKNYSDTTAGTVTGLNIDFDKTGDSTSNNTMYGVKVDMDNATATNGNNYMYGLYVTPTLTHAADAGGAFVYGAYIDATAGTNGSGLAQAAYFKASGGDFNHGIIIDCENGASNFDFRIRSSADNTDHFTIQVGAAGETTFTTVDSTVGATADLTLDVDGDISLEPAAGSVKVTGIVSGSGEYSMGSNVHISGDQYSGGALNVSGNVLVAGTTHLSSSGAEALRIGKADADSREIVFESEGTDKVSIYMNSAENFFIRQEDSSKDINLRIGTTNALVVDGSATQITSLWALSGSSTLSSQGTITTAGGINVQSSGIANAGNITGAGNVSGSGEFACLNIDAADTIDGGNGFGVSGVTVVTSGRGGKFTTVSGSSDLNMAGNASIEGNLGVTGSIRGKELQMTSHAYNVGGNSERLIPFYNLTDNNFASTDYLQQLVAPVGGRLVRVIFRPAVAQAAGSNTYIRLYKNTNTNADLDGGTLITHEEVECSANIATSNVFNFSGSSHFSAGEIIGVSIEPQTGPGDVNVTCLWEFDFTGVL